MITYILHILLFCGDDFFKIKLSHNKNINICFEMNFILFNKSQMFNYSINKTFSFSFIRIDFSL